VRNGADRVEKALIFGCARSVIPDLSAENIVTSPDNSQAVCVLIMLIFELFSCPLTAFYN
jgi:hypothetical protein